MSSTAQPWVPDDVPYDESPLTHQLAARLRLRQLRHLHAAIEALAPSLRLAGRPVHVPASALPLLAVLGAICEVGAGEGFRASDRHSATIPHSPQRSSE